MGGDAKSMFASVTRDVQKGLLIAPLLRTYLFDAKWPEDFTITFTKGQSYRPPDGWFHPSQHPALPARLLWFYLTQPEGLDREYMEHGNTLSVTMGTAMHGFIEVCLRHLGILMREDELIEAGFEINPVTKEPMVRDDEAGSRGAMDGVGKVPLTTGGAFADISRIHFEFKTSNNNALQHIDDLDLDAFIEKYPVYYAQAQEYLRMSGLQMTVLVFLGMGYPWHLREFHIPANPRFQIDVREKYLKVRASAAQGVMPPPCCTTGSKTAKQCIARFICPVGQA